MSYQEDLILSMYGRGEPGLAMGNIPPGKGGAPGQPYDAPKEDPKNPYVPAPKRDLAMDDELSEFDLTEKGLYMNYMGDMFMNLDGMLFPMGQGYDEGTHGKLVPKGLVQSNQSMKINPLIANFPYDFEGGVVTPRYFTPPRYRNLPFLHMRTKDIKDEEFLGWVLSFDKNDHAKQVKENMKPFETLFFEVGAEILKNVSGYIAANPDKAVQGIKKRLDAAIKDVKKGGDLKKLNRLQIQMDRLNAIGGLKSIVPTEGIVFKYQGKTYKFTGAFAPVNQITGLMSF